MPSLKSFLPFITWMIRSTRLSASISFDFMLHMTVLPGKQVTLIYQDHGEPEQIYAETTNLSRAAIVYSDLNPDFMNPNLVNSPDFVAK